MAVVPVDDYVTGDLPAVCARSGAAADGLVEVRDSPAQAWWILLVFLGPIGIAAIAVLFALHQRRRITGFVPMTHGALAAQNRLHRVGTLAWLVPFALLGLGVVALLVTGFGPFDRFVALGGLVLLALAVVGGILVLGGVEVLSARRAVHARLDGSGRWVEIRNAHPAFVEAARQQTLDRRRNPHASA